ncbi:hypothetical protein ACFE04_006813 [Oxalis oulophora]
MSQPIIKTNTHILMFPWFSINHITPYLNLANILAGKGYKITFLLPTKTQTHFQKSILYPDSITLKPLTLSAVDGLPAEAATAEDISTDKTHLLFNALDSTRSQVETLISEAKPDLVMHDVVTWISEITKPVGIKVVSYNVINTSVLIANYFVLQRSEITEEELTKPPEGYPYPNSMLRPHEARKFLLLVKENQIFFERVSDSLKGCDLIAIRTCYPVDGILTDYLGKLYDNPVILTSPVLSDPVEPPLDDQLVKWMSGFGPNSVVFCSFGKDFSMDKRQFQELCLGIESTGLPFLVSVRQLPIDAASIQEALPDGFEERVKGKSLVLVESVRQKEIVSNPSVGCFVSDCGFSSMWDFLLNDCQVVLVPNSVDQIFNTRLLADGHKFKLAFEVERDVETGWFSKENLCKAINTVMDKDNELGLTLKKNHDHLKNLFTTPDYFMVRYIHKTMGVIQELIESEGKFSFIL